MIYIIFATVFLASFVHGSLGMGFQIVAMAIFPMFLPYLDSLVILLMLSCVFSIQIVLRLRKYIDYRIMVFPVLFALVGRVIGFAIIMRADEELLITILGSILIIFSLYFIAFSSRNFIIEGRLAGSVTGMISGISGGVTNIGGPPLVIYFVNITSSKEQFLATVNVIYLITNFFSLALHVHAGNVDTQALTYAVLLIIPLVIGLKLGVSVLLRIDRVLLKRLIYMVMIIIGIKMIL